MNPTSFSRILRFAGWALIVVAVLVVCVRMLEDREDARRSRPGDPGQAIAETPVVEKLPADPGSSSSSAAPALSSNLPARKAAPVVRAPAAHHAGVPAADTAPLANILAGKPFTLLDHDRPVAFELALDELHVPTAPVGQRLRQVPQQPDAASLLRLAKELGVTENAVPNLVIYPAGEARKPSSRRIVTDRLLLRLSDPAVAEQIADAADLRITFRPDYAPGYVVVESRRAGVASGLEAMSRLNGRQGVVSAAPLLARQQTKKVTIPNDTYFSEQWHLRNTGQGGGTSGADAAVTTAWDTYQGGGVTIGVVDDGVQFTHPDLAPNADPAHQYDWNDFPPDTDPTPDPANDDFHGTSVAGVAAARGGNGLGVSGAAPQSKIVGFRLIAAETTDQEEAEAMSLHNGVIQIKNNSWGSPDDEPWVLGTVGPLFLDALENGVTTGRGGRGVIYVWAAGNGRAEGDQSNKDAYDNSIYVLPVGALTNAGTRSSYSETGSNLVVSAPSSGGTLKIVTTDLVGSEGYNTSAVSGNLADPNYTNDFGGTSSAAPLVSGVVALMLEANPDLDWRDVKEILLRSSTQISLADTGWVSRVVGDPVFPPIKHNEKFGGGRINAQAAVALAAAWPARAPMIQMSDSRNYAFSGVLIPDNNTAGVQTSFDMSGRPAMRVEHVEVTISASHTYRGDLQITLTSPAGVVSTLADVSSEDQNFGAIQRYDDWTFSTVRHWGESSVGVWKVAVKDLAANDTGRLESVSVRFSGIAAPPQDIAVEQPAGTGLVDGGTTGVDFGNTATDNSGTRTFTVKNVGDFTLSGIAVSIDGPDASDFSLLSNPAGSLGASGSATFVLQFAPATTGPKQAALHIASNDPDESPFDIPLAGTGTPAVGYLAFGAAGFTVNETDGSIDIPITRYGGSFGAVTVSLSTVNGSAVAPGDFTPQSGQTVSLDDGVTSAMLMIPIVDTPSGEANETFTVTLSNPTHGARLGSPAQAPVTIIDASSLSQLTDTAAPAAPVISTPGANALVNVAPGATVSIAGSAKDNKGVKQVQMSLNGGVFTDASLGTPGATGTTFSAMLVPQTGSNTVQVRSVDYADRVSTTVTRTFRVPGVLVVNVDGSLGSVTPGFAPSSLRELGLRLTVTATPKPPKISPAFAGAIFTGWAIGGSDVANGGSPFTTQRIGVAASALEKTTLNFIFREGLVLTANFVTSPFAPVAGAYNGLIRPSSALPDRAPLGGAAGPEDGTARTNGTEGSFAATVMNTGAFSGKLTIDRFSLGVAGAFDHNGVARFGTARALSQVVARPNKPSLLVELQLDLVTPGTSDKIRGTITATDFKRSVITAVSTVDADRAFYNGTTQIVPASYLGAVNANGIFTAAFPARDVSDQPAGFTAQDFPQGDGVATITLTKAGVVSLAGTLADGTPVGASSALSEGRTFPLFIPIYNKLGFLSGQVRLNGMQPASDMAATDLQWLRPFISTSHYYPAGWPEVIKVDLMAAKYVVVAGQSVLKAPDGADAGFDGDNLQAADDDGNVALSFSDGQLTETLIKVANLSASDVVTKIPANDPSFTLTINRATGAISGSFTHTDDTVSTYKGMIYQKGPNAGAYGFFLTKQPVPVNYTGESGGVSLIGHP